MGRNLQLFKKARERIEANLATERGAPLRPKPPLRSFRSLPRR